MDRRIAFYIAKNVVKASNCPQKGIFRLIWNHVEYVNIKYCQFTIQRRKRPTPYVLIVSKPRLDHRFLMSSPIFVVLHVHTNHALWRGKLRVEMSILHLARCLSVHDKGGSYVSTRLKMARSKLHVHVIKHVVAKHCGYRNVASL